MLEKPMQLRTPKNFEITWTGTNEAEINAFFNKSGVGHLVVGGKLFCNALQHSSCLDDEGHVPLFSVLRSVATAPCPKREVIVINKGI